MVPSRFHADSQVFAQASAYPILIVSPDDGRDGGKTAVAVYRLRKIIGNIEASVSRAFSRQHQVPPGDALECLDEQ